jgi:hypothetical protein
MVCNVTALNRPALQLLENLSRIECLVPKMPRSQAGAWERGVCATLKPHSHERGCEFGSP